MDRLTTDLRFAARLLRRSPAWTAIAILSLALGIGANAVVFSLVDAVLLDALPYPDAGRLVLLWGSRTERTTPGLSGADLADWRTHNRTFDDLDAFLGQRPVSLGSQETDRVNAACIGHRVLPLLGVPLARGRNFTADEAHVGAAPVIIVSDALWRTRLGSDPNVIGRVLPVDGIPREIVGVTPAGFFFPDTDARLWVPAPCGFANADRRGAMVLHAVGRLRPGVSVATAQADLDVITAQLARSYPETNRRKTAGVFPLRHILIGQYERALTTLVWAIALVLVIACVNVIHLQLARGVDRQTELAVRAASGAGRRRLLRQLFTETCLLVGLAGVAAVAVTWIGVRLIHTFALTDIPRLEHARLDGRVWAFTLGVSILTALVSGLWPAWKASGVRIGETLTLGAAATTGAGRHHTRDLLAITEIAAAVTLLVASGLVVKSFVQLSRADWGFIPDRVLLLDVQLPNRARGDRHYHEALTDDLIARLSKTAGVAQVTVGNNAPIRWGGYAAGPIGVDGRVRPETAAIWAVGRGYFSTLGIPLVDGREFDDHDDAGAPRGVVLSRALAQQLWPRVSPIGKRLQLLYVKEAEIKRRYSRAAAQRMSGWPPDPDLYDVLDDVEWDVIGVVADVKMFGLDGSGTPALYLETRQQPRSPTWVSAGTRLKVLLRTSGAPLDVAAAAKAEVLAAEPEATFVEIAPLADLVSQSIGGRGSNRLLFVVASIFGILALSFATIGIYGVVAHNVVERLREIGIRLALGAARRDVVRIVLGYGLRLLVSGLALGVTMAWAATRGMQSLLFATTPTDPMTYAGVIAVFAVAALLACALPLRRALRCDPVTLFRV